MRSFRFTILKNALANIMRGGASAVVAIVLPHFLTHLLGHDRFAGWALMLQLAAYANYLDFGLQTAVARYLAGALEKGDQEQCDRVVSNATAILTIAGAIAVCILGLIAWQLPHLFRSVPAALIGEIALGLTILGVSAAINLPLSVYTGVLVGMQRNEYPAIAMAISRLFGASAVILVAHRTQSLVWLAICVGGFNLIAGLSQYVIVRKLLPTLRIGLALERGMTIDLVRYCSTLSVWSMAMLLISGLDVIIVGFFEFKATGAYSIAATLILLFTGFNGAVSSALMAPIAVMQARQEYSKISRLILIATRMNSYFSIGAIIVTFLFGNALVRAWVGPAYLSLTLPVLEILLVAQAIRLVGNAYGTALVSMGLQRHGLIPVLVEGASNLFLSILGMILIGPEGVAWATLVAASTGVTIYVLFILPSITEIKIRSSIFVRQGIVIPLLPFLPCFAWTLCRKWWSGYLEASLLARWLPLTISLLIAACFTWSGIRHTLQAMGSDDRV